MTLHIIITNIIVLLHVFCVFLRPFIQFLLEDKRSISKVSSQSVQYCKQVLSLLLQCGIERRSEERSAHDGSWNIFIYECGLWDILPKGEVIIVRIGWEDRKYISNIYGLIENTFLIVIDCLDKISARATEFEFDLYTDSFVDLI